MTEGLISIALAAAHLEAQQKLKKPRPLPLRKSATGDGLMVPLTKSIGETARVVSSSTDNESDEDPIIDPEETINRILAEHPRDPPDAPASDVVITKVLPDDVLCGRGGETNHHPGNVQYRGLVKKYQRLYLKAKRRDKPKIARLIVDTVRRCSGRFLKKDPLSGNWKDVGNNKAREKTSQALREGAPEIRETDPNKRKVPTPMMGVVGNVVSPATSSEFQFPIAPHSTNIIIQASEDAPSNKKMRVELEDNTSEDADGAGGDATRGPRLHRLKSRLMCDEKLEDEV